MRKHLIALAWTGGAWLASCVAISTAWAQDVDRAAWGVFADLAGRGWNNDSVGIPVRVEWEQPGKELVIRNSNGWVGRRIKPGATRGELLYTDTNAGGSAHFIGHVDVDGTVLFRSQGLFKSAFRIEPSAGGGWQQRWLKMRRGEVTTETTQTVHYSVADGGAPLVTANARETQPAAPVAAAPMEPNDTSLALAPEAGAGVSPSVALAAPVQSTATTTATVPSDASAGGGDTSSGQSPASAQRFLAMLALNGTLRFGWLELVSGIPAMNRVPGTYSEKKLFGEGAPAATAEYLPPFTITAVDTIGMDGRASNCTTTLRAFAMPPLQLLRDDGYFIHRYQDPQVLFGGPRMIDWSTVTAIEASGLQLLLVRGGQRYPLLAFVLPDQAMHARVHYAMEYLRLQCDATASTGF